MTPAHRYPPLVWQRPLPAGSCTTNGAHATDALLEQAHTTRAMVLPLLERIAYYFRAMDTADVIASALARALTSNNAALWVPGPQVCGRWCAWLTGIAAPTPGYAVIQRCDELLNALLVRQYRRTHPDTAVVCERYRPTASHAEHGASVSRPPPC